MNALPIVVGLLALGLTVALLIPRKGAGRSGLAAFVVSLALVSPVCSMGAGIRAVIACFKTLASGGGGGVAVIAPVCLASLRMAFLGTAAFLAVAGTGALLVILGGRPEVGTGSGETAGSPSRGRIAILLGICCLGPLLAGVLLESGSRQALLIMRVILPSDLVDPSEFAGMSLSQFSSDLSLRLLAILWGSAVVSLLLIALAAAGWVAGKRLGASRAIGRSSAVMMLILCLVAGGYMALSYSRMSWIEEMTRITLSRDAAPADRP